MPSMQHTKERRNRTDYAGLLSHEKARFPVDGRRVDVHRRSGRCRGADCKERTISTAAAFRGLRGVELARTRNFRRKWKVDLERFQSRRL